MGRVVTTPQIRHSQPADVNFKNCDGKAVLELHIHSTNWLQGNHHWMCTRQADCFLLKYCHLSGHYYFKEVHLKCQGTHYTINIDVTQLHFKKNCQK